MTVAQTTLARIVSTAYNSLGLFGGSAPLLWHGRGLQVTGQSSLPVKCFAAIYQASLWAYEMLRVSWFEGSLLHVFVTHSTGDSQTPTRLQVAARKEELLADIELLGHFHCCRAPARVMRYLP